MRFSCSAAEASMRGELIYREAEYSLDFVCSESARAGGIVGDGGCMSLTIETLQIEVAVETGMLLYPWGFLPLRNSSFSPINVPRFILGGVHVCINETKLIKGVAFEVPGASLWVTVKDPDNGWIYIGPENYTSGNVVYIKFADNSIVGISDGLMYCIFLKPTFIG